MYIPRLIRRMLEEALAAFPSVMLTGPRQSGKTTFLREELGDRFDYATLDDPLERSFARSDPNGFLDRFQERPVVLDEIQYVPEILSYIKIRIDRDRARHGQWILTGSQQFHLMRNISESLAGRIAILELHPFSLLEHNPGGRDLLANVVWVGRYPEPALQTSMRDLWIRAYIETYIERDVRHLLNVQNLSSFETFLGVCAANHGQLLNMATVSRQCGISKPTVKAWAGILQASYVVTLLKPYYQNFGKRLVKSPKLYFIDPAIVCALTRQPTGEAALAGAMGGALFEGLVVSEAIKVIAMHGKLPDVFFWRSRDGLEVDLIVQTGGRLIPIEIKLTATPSMGHLTSLNRLKALAGAAADKTGLLVCRVSEPRSLPHDNLALPWHMFPAWLDTRLTTSR